MKPIFEIKVSRRNKEYFVLKARNGKIILVSEEYNAHQNVLKGIESVRTNCRTLAQFEKCKDLHGYPYFVLKAANHKVIGTSEIYTGNWQCNRGILSVMLNGKSAKVVVAEAVKHLSPAKLGTTRPI
jgi:uncharacterized protein YegP (UPF0339 family)